MEIDYSKDGMQSCNHSVVYTTGSATNDMPKANREYYSVSRNPQQAVSDVIAKCKCLACGEIDIKASAKYCSNCGLLFADKPENST